MAQGRRLNRNLVGRRTRLRACPAAAAVGGQTRDAGKPEAFRGLILETMFGCRAFRLYSAKVVNGDFKVV